MRLVKGWLVAVPLAVLVALGLAVGLVFLLPLSGGGDQPSHTSDQQRLDLDLEKQIQEFVAAMPPRSGYTPPTPEQRQAIARGVAQALDGDIEGAQATLGQVGYTIFVGQDRGTGRRFAEVYDQQLPSRGWGRVLIDLTARPSVAIQVPHPGADMWSELMGVELFRAVPGSVMVIAGANRRAGPGERADMAHNTDTVFFAVHEVLRERGLPAVQLHGFIDVKLPDFDVVVSAGPPKHGDLAERTANVLADHGFRVCRPWERACGKLEATTNAQARSAYTRGWGEFVHVEVNQTVRSTERWRKELVLALASLVDSAGPAAGPTLPGTPPRKG